MVPWIKLIGVMILNNANMVRIQQNKCTGRSKWFVLFYAMTIISGCSNVELTQRSVDLPAERQYRDIYVDVILSNTEEIAYVTRRLNQVLEKRDLRIIPSKQIRDTSVQKGLNAALLRVEEIERRTETIVRYRQYGRTSLTINHGREVHNKPVVTLRVTLVDYPSGQTVFEADYITQGQWYEESREVIASLADTLVEQLADEGFIAAPR